MSINFDNLLATVEAEANKFETTKAAVLLTFDGRPVHEPATQAEKEAALLGPVREAVAAVHEAAQLAQQQAAVKSMTVQHQRINGGRRG